MSSSGHWEVEKGGRAYYCSVSGGYVMVGVRSNPKSGFEVTENDNSPIENYSTAAVRNFIKQQLGDKILDEVDKKVKVLMEIKNKTTSGPGKES